MDPILPPQAFYLDSKDRAKLFDLVGNVADADRAMVCRTGDRPLVYEFLRAHRELVAAVGVADLHDWARHAFALGGEQEDFSVAGLHDRKERDRAVLDGHLDGQTLAGFSMIDRKRDEPHAGLRDGKMRGPVVA